jgi:hypothetical protein
MERTPTCAYWTPPAETEAGMSGDLIPLRRKPVRPSVRRPRRPAQPLPPDVEEAVVEALSQALEEAYKERHPERFPTTTPP